MLPAQIEENENYKFVIDHGNPLCVVLASQALLAANTPVQPLWHREAGDQRSFDALIRWIGVRRARWQEWGRLAEALGRDRFYLHMAERMALEPIRECVASVVQPLDDPRALRIGEMLNGATGMVIEELYVHHFDTAAKRKQFLDWFYTADNCDHAGALIQVAYSHGTTVLGEMLDQIASGPKHSKANRKTARRSARKTRKAA
jgi:hypothetical protein